MFHRKMFRAERKRRSLIYFTLPSYLNSQYSLKTLTNLVDRNN